MSDIKEEYHLKNLTGSDAKRILEIADQENIDVEAIIDFIKKLKGVKKMSNEKTDDEKRFSEEEKKVQEFMAKPENKGVSYRDAALKVLDRSEPEVKEEFTEEQKKEKEDNKAIEDYIKDHPGTSYKNAVRIVLNKEEMSLEEKVIEEYIEKNDCTYREAVLAVLPLTKKEE
ncbi:hypothetical protein ES708_23584 [subsurface metagenome]